MHTDLIVHLAQARKNRQLMYAAVLAAYGLGADARTDDILTDLVQINTQRAAEEAQDRVRWLRPDFQNPQELTQKQELPAQEQQALEANLDTEKVLLK